jgi:hypothetical protein
MKASSKPSRKPQIRTDGIRGQTSQSKVFESLLERDYFHLLEIDRTVAAFHSQPIVIPYEYPAGYGREYFPDVLVEFFPSVRDARPLLVEIKPKAVLEEADPKLMRKIEVGRTFAHANGWHFQVVTEADMPPTRVDNAKFLSMFLGRVPDDATKSLLTTQLQDLGLSSVENLLAAIYRDKWNQAAILPFVWHMIAKGPIGTDLNESLTMRSPIWLEE